MAGQTMTIMSAPDTTLWESNLLDGSFIDCSCQNVMIT